MITDSNKAHVAKMIGRGLQEELLGRMGTPEVRVPR